MTGYKKINAKNLPERKKYRADRVLNHKFYLNLHAMRKWILLAVWLPVLGWAQKDGKVNVAPEDAEVDMDQPTFVPMVKVSKALHEGDSIQYVEFGNVYVYPQPVFKNEKQRQQYNPSGVQREEGAAHGQGGEQHHH